MYAKNGYGQSSFQRYRAVKIQTASPAQIMLMLYDGAIRFALIARKKIDEKDYAAKGTYLGKVQAILSELMSSLDFSVAPELCERLEQLYLYMMERLTKANLELDTQPVDEVVELLKTLREGWNEALTSLPNDPTAGRTPSGGNRPAIQRPEDPRNKNRGGPR
ncbi:MAG: flagellar export chaperone FliS [Myxococcota bacterium]|nr:flagellar export chaperone FliS [Myxococcota bacterium]